MPTTHRLKCGTDYFWAVDRREKPFEVRRDDRGFQKGDKVVLVETYRAGDIREGRPTGNEIERRITYILTGGQWGIEPGYVVLALK